MMGPPRPSASFGGVRATSLDIRLQRCYAPPVNRERNFFLAVAVSGLALTGCSDSTPADDAAVADTSVSDVATTGDTSSPADAAADDTMVMADASEADAGDLDAEVSTDDAGDDAFVAIL